MKVAVTGATGFLGRYVVEELERRSISPVLVCRPSSRPNPSLLRHTVVRIDFSETGEHVFHMMGKPDILIHLAWGGLQDFKSLRHYEVETPLHYFFLKALLNSGLENLLVTGTCLEYGLQSGALNENKVARPTTPYGFAKDSLRQALEYVRGDKHFNLNWARLFYIYGDGQTRNALLPQLKKAVERGESVFNMSGGEQLRDYLPVAQAAKDIVSLALSMRNNGPVNVCSGKPTSVRRLVESWIRENDWPIAINLGHYSYADYEPMAFWGDNAKFIACVAQ